MLESCKENPFPYAAFEQEKLFFIGEVERLLEHIDGAWGLLEQELDRGVGDDRDTVRALHKVSHVLGDRTETEVVLTASFCN